MITTEERDNLIAKFLCGEATPEEAMQLNDWLDQSEQNKDYFKTASHVLDYTIPEPNLTKAKRQIYSKLNNNTRSYQWIGIAAAIVLVIGITWILVPKKPLIESELIWQATGKNEELALIEGSNITLFAGSNLREAKGFGKTNRKLFLKGSAYFSITHQDSLPLIVYTERYAIRDLGTKFLVQQSEDSIYIKVDEGEVAIEDRDTVIFTIQAGEALRLSIDFKKPLEKPHKPTATTKNRTFHFNKMALRNVLKELQMGYDVPISLANSNLNDCPFTSSFDNEDLETILTVICETLELRFEHKDKGYVIIGDTCS